MRKILAYLILSTCFILSGCAWLSVYQPSVQQGNILSDAAVAKLKIGMSKNQVVQILGSPVLINNYNSNRWDYVYTLQTNGKPKLQEQVLTLYFTQDRLVKIVGLNERTVKLS